MKIKIDNQTVLIDRADLHFVDEVNWRARDMGWGVYICHRSMFLHRLIAGCAVGDGQIVDHENRNTLDNRRKNLRLVDASASSANRQCGWGESGQRNVRWKNDRWEASFVYKGEFYYVGRYDDVEEAGVAARAARLAVMVGATD